MKPRIHLPVVLLAAFVVSVAHGADEPHGFFPAFKAHTIDRIGAKMGQTALADMDRDGDLDWISGSASHASSDIWWWEYQAPGHWIRHDVGKGNTDVGAAVHDVNGDGWPDILSGSRLLINPGNPKNAAFKAYEVGTIHSHDTEFADINGDGKMDAIANSDKTGLFWYEIPDPPTQKWISHTIATIKEHNIHGGISPHAVGDIDGDGDSDVVTAQAWYENLEGGGLKWKQHKNINLGEEKRYGIAVRTWVGDMDGDNDLDIVQAEADHPDGRVAWFENDGKGEWTRHLIRDKGRGQDFHSLAVADFDGDGDWDVFSGAGPLSESKNFKCYIWENLAGKNNKPDSSKWKEHEIASKPCHEAVAADVDGDGDIDVCSKPWSTGNEHYFLENQSRLIK